MCQPFGVSAGQVTLYVRRSATGLIRRFRNSSPGAFDTVGDFTANIVGWRPGERRQHGPRGGSWRHSRL